MPRTLTRPNTSPNSSPNLLPNFFSPRQPRQPFLPHRRKLEVQHNHLLRSLPRLHPKLLRPHPHQLHRRRRRPLPLPLPRPFLPPLRHRARRPGLRSLLQNGRVHWRGQRRTAKGRRMHLGYPRTLRAPHRLRRRRRRDQVRAVT